MHTANVAPAAYIMVEMLHSQGFYEAVLPYGLAIPVKSILQWAHIWSIPNRGPSKKT